MVSLTWRQAASPVAGSSPGKLGRLLPCESGQARPPLPTMPASFAARNIEYGQWIRQACFLLADVVLRVDVNGEAARTVEEQRVTHAHQVFLFEVGFGRQVAGQ